jgi:hypothetical protein
MHSDLDWRLWIEKVAATQPHAQWLEAFNSEAGIRQHHNMRAFLLALLASATSIDDPGVRKLVSPVRDALQRIS